MKPPISHRHGIPFFYKKTETEFQKDIYERFDNMVVKQSALHLADEQWGEYPLQIALDFAKEYYGDQPLANILEIGCSVGRWIATVAQNHPQANCWGIDYSYQLLKRAQEFWVDGNNISIDLTKKGFANRMNLTGSKLSNLNFGLAKASSLPFDENSQDVVLNSFLLDRLEDPRKGLIEMNRVLRPNGILIMITPLNFNTARHWNDFYPPIKIHEFLIKKEFTILDWKEEMIIKEPLDVRGNFVNWNCVAIAARKGK